MDLLLDVLEASRLKVEYWKLEKTFPWSQSVSTDSNTKYSHEVTHMPQGITITDTNSCAQ
jgi:hypothetical protein